MVLMGKRWRITHQVSSINRFPGSRQTQLLPRGDAEFAARPETTLGWESFAVIAMTFLIGLALTIRHEVYADNVQ